MNLQEYLRDFKRWPATLTAAEFAVSGVPDMGRKWLKKYRYLEVEADAMRAAFDAESQDGGRVIIRSGRVLWRTTEKPVFARPKALDQGGRPRPARRIKVSSEKLTHAIVNADAFLESFEWRQARFATLQRYGRKCQCCGATPASGAVMHVDHIKSRRRFPELALDLENLQILCDACNHGKSNQTADFRSE
ncbi:MAG TPA: HNH endonuclease signature motif containing protein [Telluria sp.]|jgi:5-methylcytosine-specific restriction endonuclease McrA